MVSKHKPDIVINAAGRVGGILDNYNFQSDYLYVKHDDWNEHRQFIFQT